MALTHDITPSWLQGMPVRHARASTLLASTLVYKGAVCMQVEGKIMPVLTGTSMAAKVTAFGTGNSLLYASARRDAVTLAIIDPAGNSQVERVEVTIGATLAISVYSATDGGGALTSTPNTIAQSIRRHAAANNVLRVKPGGTGAGAIVAAAATAVNYVSLLGAASRRMDNSDSVSDLTLAASVGVFEQGVLKMSTADAPALPTIVAFADDGAIKITHDALDILAPCVQISGSAYYVDLAAAF